MLLHHLQQSIAGFYPTGWLVVHPNVKRLLDHGSIGVDVFFLISGFIVFLAAQRVIHARKGVRLFLIKRFLRIFLPYWPIALVLAAAYALLPILSAAADPIQVNWLKSITLIPGGGRLLPVRCLDAQFRALLLSPAWSLPRLAPTSLALGADPGAVFARAVARCSCALR